MAKCQYLSFQFPSNGKADRKRIPRHKRRKTSLVSIPFKRESGSQGKRRIVRKRWQIFRFQFPSNGKADRKGEQGDKLRRLYKSFNSLQTGKRIASYSGRPDNILTFVSFQFPSNGKADRKCSEASCHMESARVSIPFKRESGSQGVFFPQGCDEIYRVSIPFKRESGSQDHHVPLHRQALLPGFNSLQTGKRIARDPILSPVGPWLQKPKNIRELRGAIFERNLVPKIPQTHVCIDPYAIF